MTRKTIRRALALILTLATLLAMTAVLPASAAVAATVYIEDTFEGMGVTNGNVTDKALSADFSGSNNYAIVGENTLSGSRSALVNNHVDWRWWGRNIATENLTMAFSVSFLPTESLDLTVCMTLSTDSSTNSEGLGGRLVAFCGDGTHLGVYDYAGELITSLEYNVPYTVTLTVTAKSDALTMTLNGKTYEGLPMASAFFAATAFRFNAVAGSSFYFDDFSVYSTARVFPQKYSTQAPGAMVELDYPTYYESEGITLWLNRDGTEAGKSALKLDMPVKEANNTLYLPYDQVREQIATGETTELDPMLITWDGTEYITVQDTADLIGGKVWWDEAQEMVVFTDGERLEDGILRSINGRFYMNGQPYYEISFNKFDLAAQLLINYFPNNFRDFNTGEDQRANAERALRELSENGFTTIRFFSYAETYDMIHDPVESEKYWAALDELFDLCDKYGLKAVPSLFCGTTVMTACEYVEGVGYVSMGEDTLDLIADPESKSREFQRAYIETYVNRYKDRDTILMWEINNEMNLGMDIGATVGAPTYSAYQLSEFYTFCTDIINECDPDRLVTSGDSVQRGSNYHLLAGVMAGREANDWTTDTYGQRLYMNYLLHGVSGMDVTCVHAYGESAEKISVSNNMLKRQAARVSLHLMEAEARALGQPLYVGEAGTGTANGNTDLAAIKATLDGFVDLGLQLVHWWSYDTCRVDSFGDDQSWNMNMTEFSESVALVKAANEALKAEWLVNRAEEDVAVTDPGDQGAATDTPAETDAPATDAPATEGTPAATESPATNTPAPVETAPAEGGCGSAVHGLWVLLPLAALLRRRED